MDVRQIETRLTPTMDSTIETQVEIDAEQHDNWDYHQTDVLIPQYKRKTDESCILSQTPPRLDGAKSSLKSNPSFGTDACESGSTSHDLSTDSQPKTPLSTHSACTIPSANTEILPTQDQDRPNWSDDRMSTTRLSNDSSDHSPRVMAVDDDSQSTTLQSDGNIPCANDRAHKRQRQGVVVPRSDVVILLPSSPQQPSGINGDTHKGHFHSPLLSSRTPSSTDVQVSDHIATPSEPSLVTRMTASPNGSASRGGNTSAQADGGAAPFQGCDIHLKQHRSLTTQDQAIQYSHSSKSSCILGQFSTSQTTTLSTMSFQVPTSVDWEESVTIPVTPLDGLDSDVSLSRPRDSDAHQTASAGMSPARVVYIPKHHLQSTKRSPCLSPSLLRDDDASSDDDDDEDDDEDESDGGITQSIVISDSHHLHSHSLDPYDQVLAAMPVLPPPNIDITYDLSLPDPNNECFVTPQIHPNTAPPALSLQSEKLPLPEARVVQNSFEGCNADKALHFYHTGQTPAQETKAVHHITSSGVAYTSIPTPSLSVFHPCILPPQSLPTNKPLPHDGKSNLFVPSHRCSCNIPSSVPSPVSEGSDLSDIDTGRGQRSDSDPSILVMVISHRYGPLDIWSTPQSTVPGHAVALLHQINGPNCPTLPLKRLGMLAQILANFQFRNLSSSTAQGSSPPSVPGKVYDKYLPLLSTHIETVINLRIMQYNSSLSMTDAAESLHAGLAPPLTRDDGEHQNPLADPLPQSHEEASPDPVENQQNWNELNTRAVTPSLVYSPFLSKSSSSYGVVQSHLYAFINSLYHEKEFAANFMSTITPPVATLTAVDFKGFWANLLGLHSDLDSQTGLPIAGSSDSTIRFALHQALLTQEEEFSCLKQLHTQQHEELGRTHHQQILALSRYQQQQRKLVIQQHLHKLTTILSDYRSQASELMHDRASSESHSSPNSDYKTILPSFHEEYTTRMARLVAAIDELLLNADSDSEQKSNDSTSPPLTQDTQSQDVLSDDSSSPSTEGAVRQALQEEGFDCRTQDAIPSSTKPTRTMTHNIPVVLNAHISALFTVFFP